MKQWNKIPSAVQIVIADMLIVWSLSSFIMAVWNTIKPGSFGDMSLRGVGNWVWYLIGIAIFSWMLREIFYPKVDRSFCSTHPSYLLLDGIIVVVAGFLQYYSFSSGYNGKHITLIFYVSLLVPSLRLIAWYLLGLKIKDTPELQTAWQPAIMVVIPTFVVFAVIGSMVFIGNRKQQNEMANLPIIDRQTFADSRETFKRLSDPKKIITETGFVRLRAKQISNEPMHCQNNNNIEFVSVWAELGSGGDVLIVGSKYSNWEYDELIKRAINNNGKMIEVVGKLREMPPTGAVDDWKAYCGMTGLPSRPKGGRWVLEMVKP